MSIPWLEKVNAISVNPDMATREDIARLAAEHSGLMFLLIDWTKFLLDSGWINLADELQNKIDETVLDANEI